MFVRPLHSAGGMMWDPFLEQLAAHYTIHAPLVAGTVPGKPDAIRQVADLWDLVLVYEETITALDLHSPPVIGQSFGGMLACELAAHCPTLFSRLVVLDPIGLWLDDHPVANWVAKAPDELPALLFHSPDSDVGSRHVHASRQPRGCDRGHRRIDVGHRVHLEVRLAGSRQGPGQAHPSDPGADAGRLG